MHRFIAFGILCMLLAAPFGSTAVSARQSDSPLTSMMLRLDLGDQWTVNPDKNGDPNTSEFAQVSDGELHRELPPSTAAWYEEHEVQNVRIYSVEFLHSTADANSLPFHISMRIVELADESHALTFLESALDSQLTAVAAGEQRDARFEPIDPLPPADHPVAGWTYQAVYTDSLSGKESFSSAVRYIMQVDNYVVSAYATGPYLDYNFDLAYWLAQEQAACVAAASTCAPIPVPMGDDNWIYDVGTLFYMDPETGIPFAAEYEFPIDEIRRAPELTFTFGT